MRNALLALAATLCFSTAHAAIIINNLPVNDGGSATIDSSAGLNAAMGFTMSAGSAYSLTSVTLRLDAVDPGDVPLIRLYSDSGSNPSSPLITLLNPTFPSAGPTSYVFTAPSLFELLPSTSYWVVADDTSGNGYSWRRNSPVTFPTGIATHLGTRFNGNPPTTNADSFAYGITIEGNAVPEPGTLALLGLGLAGLAATRRRKQ